MAEEVRFFVRVAGFALLIAVVYWFVSYDVVGTIFLGSVAVAGAVFVSAALTSVRATRAGMTAPGASGIGRVTGTVKRVIGFEEHGGPAHASPLEIEDEALPSSSVWPFVAGAGAVFAGAALVFGAWFWLPAVILGAFALHGWTTQIKPG